MWQKNTVIEKYIDLESDPSVQFPHSEACKWGFGIGWRSRKHLLSKWLGKSESIRAHVGAQGKRGKEALRAYTEDTHKGKYADWEDELYIRFSLRRTVLGYP